MAARSVHSIVASTLLILTCLVLGLLAGGMLVIGVSLVSFWKSLAPSDFQAWFAAHAHLVGRLMIPLGVGAIAVTVAAGAACWRGSATARCWLLIAAVSAIGVMPPTRSFSRPPTRRSRVGTCQTPRRGPCSIAG